MRIPEGFASQKLFVLPEYIQKELAASELTKDLFVSDIGFFPQARHHFRERKDGCDSHIVIYCTEGEGFIELSGGRRLRLTSRQLAVIPAGVSHRYGASESDPWSIYWFHVKGEHALPLFRMYSLDDGAATLPLSVHTSFLEGFGHIFGLLEDKAYFLPAQVHVAQTVRYLLGMIGLSAGLTPQAQKRERYLEEAVRYMTGHLADTVTLAGLSAHTGVSRQHLIYLFNRETGFPPLEYFLRMKMQRAAQLLDLTPLSVKEISGAVGMADPYYFSRLFKKMMGASPTEYRNIPKG